ncbi:MAG: GDSL-type esterase/lipase family protein [Gammaproteobacteria bacterium]|nr:GDSL-type esterase/lipase family protein [Gammaproteobacteria bacterium]
MFGIRVSLYVLIGCLFLLQACSDSISLMPIPQDGVILAFGDSLTVGVGVSDAHSYPAVLAQLAGRKVVSSGISGEETTQGLARLPGVMDDVNPDLLILLQGGNDILRNRSLQKTKQNLAAMIELAQSSGVQIVLIGVPEKKLFSDMAPLYEELAEQYNLVLANDLLSNLLRDNEYKSDAVHLNQQGYRVLAESIHKLLVKHGAL